MSAPSPPEDQRPWLQTIDPARVGADRGIDGTTARLRVLAVDDDPMWSRALRRTLGLAGVEVDSELDPLRAIERLAARERFDAVLVDLSMPALGGLETLRRIRALGTAPAVIVVSSDATAATAASCFRAGAFHYIVKDAPPAELTAAIEGASHQTALTLGAAADVPLSPGRSAAMAKVHSDIQRLAQTDISVLIQGESGTGKELAALALHELGPRRRGRFVSVNCGAIPDTLIDSELFGHLRGAFTGADETRAGLFEQADGGTIFLDEIGDMPLAVQARLLRVLQEGEVRPLGGEGTRSIDVRVIAATHVDLPRAVAEGRFRQDLFFRFNVVTVKLPALRDRIEDLPTLAAQLLRKHGGGNHTLTPAALEALMAHRWPGNVRELENALQHAIALGSGTVIDVDALPPQLRQLARGTQPIEVEPRADLSLPDAKREIIARFERRYIERVLEKVHGNVSEASRIAGLDRANFRRLLQRHGIDATRYRS